jgi:hypothetical protein
MAGNMPEGMAMSQRTLSEWQKFKQKLTLYMKATKKAAEASDVKVAILLTAGGDIVLDE